VFLCRVFLCSTSLLCGVVLCVSVYLHVYHYVLFGLNLFILLIGNVELLCVLSTYQFLFEFPGNLLISRFCRFVIDSLTLKLEAVCSSETSVNFYQITRRHIPEDSTFCKGMHKESVYFIKPIALRNIKDTESKVKPADILLRFGCDMNNEMELPHNYFKNI
jgi:hypothetical protein